MSIRARWHGPVFPSDDLDRHIQLASGHRGASTRSQRSLCRPASGDGVRRTPFWRSRVQDTVEPKCVRFLGVILSSPLGLELDHRYQRRRHHFTSNRLNRLCNDDDGSVGESSRSSHLSLGHLPVAAGSPELRVSLLAARSLAVPPGILPHCLYNSDDRTSVHPPWTAHRDTQEPPSLPAGQHS